MKIYLVGSDNNAFITANKRGFGFLISFAELRPGGRSLRVWKTIKRRLENKKHDERDGK